MRIACDLDGPVYQFHSAAVYMMNTYRGYELNWRDWNDWDWLERVVKPEDWEWLWTEGVSLGLFRYGHVTKDAIVGIRELQAQGHEIVFVTHRPKEAVQDTLDFLSYARLQPSGVHILTQEEPKTSVSADLYIDDKRENIHSVVVYSGAKAILFNSPLNQGPVAGERDPRFRRAMGWFEIPFLVEAMSE